MENFREGFRESSSASSLTTEADVVAHSGSPDWATVLLILKSTVGGTLIVIPAAYKGAGLLSASVVVAIIAGVEIYCMVLLVRCSCLIGGGSYGQIVERCLGRYGLWAVDLSLVASQMGFVCAEMLYVGTNLPDALQSFRSVLPSWMLWSESQVIFGQMLLSVPMAWIRHLKYFSCTNALANVIILCALVFLLIFAMAGLISHGPAPGLRALGTEWVVFAGTSVFSFECINFVIPMYDAHEKKDTFVPILVGTLSFVAVVFVMFGALNYMRYGESTESPVTKNFAQSLDPSSPWGRAIQLAFAFASLLNIPLFLFPASIAIEDKFCRGRRPGVIRKWAKNGIRTLLVFACTIIAWVGSAHINALVAIVGSLCCVPLAFVYPAICHYRLFQPGTFAGLVDLGIGILGAVLFVSTTYRAILSFE